MYFRIALFTAFLVLTNALLAEPIQVRFPEGSVHGYLALRSLDGRLLASGDLVQVMRNGRLTSRLIYRFKDGSIDDDTAVYTQNGYFRLVREHHVQKGPAFPLPTELTVEAKTGMVTVRYADHGKEKVDTSHMDLPEDLSNGILLVIAKNLPPHATETTLSYLAASPKPRIVHLVITADGSDTFRSAGVKNKALRFRIHVNIGGLLGALAPLIGKEPADSFVWISKDEVPAFIKSESPLYLGGPRLRTELVGPVWESHSAPRSLSQGAQEQTK